MDKPPVPPRTGSQSRPRGPRPQQYSTEGVPHLSSQPAGQPRRVPRKPVGSVPAQPTTGHLRGPRPLSKRVVPPPPQHPQHNYSTPSLTAAPVLPPNHAPRTPYPVSPIASPVPSPTLPYPRSPSPPQISPRSSHSQGSPRTFGSSSGSLPSLHAVPPVPPLPRSNGSLTASSGNGASTSLPSLSPIPTPYPTEDPVINMADFDDVVISGEEFAELYSENNSLESFPQTTDASSTHSSIPSVLKPGGMQLNLPEIPPLVAVRPKFSAEWLGVPEFEMCADISILSALAQWILFLCHNIDAEFSNEGLTNALAKLFTFNVHTINWIQAEALAKQAFESLRAQGFVYGQDLITLRPESKVSGVLTTLSGNGCYSPHYDGHFWCYSSRCLREARIPTPSRELSRRGSVSLKEGCGLRGLFEPEWHIYWGIPAPKGEGMTKAIKRQYAIHELIFTESLYVHDLQVFTDVYGKLSSQVPSIMAQQREFCESVFDKAKIILALQKMLFSKLKGRQAQEGPHVKIIADLIYDWALAAKEAYSSYASDYLWTDQHLRTQMNLSSKVEKWLSEAGHNPALKGKPFQFFFNRIIPRALRYKLLLETIKKHTLETDPEFPMLVKAIDATNSIGKSCDEAVDKATKSQELQNINATIVFKDKQVEVDLRLNDKRRKLIKRGKMLRKSGTGIEWLETDVLLMDNFLILAKMREGQNGNSLYITKKPIFLDLLVLRSQDDEPITNFSLLSGNSGAISALENIDGRPRNPNNDENADTAIYPIRISHLGRSGGDFILFCATQIEREQWCKSIIEAKTASSASAFARNSQPFWLRKLSDTFGYPEFEEPVLPVPINSTVMSRCIGDEKPGVIVSKSRVNCMVSFGADYYFAGLDYGLYFCKERNTREWVKCLNLRIDSIRVVPEFNFLVILTRGNLVWYRLDEVLNRGFANYPDKDDVPRGYRVVSLHKIAMFNLAFVKDRLEIMYLVNGSKKGIYSVEPIRSKAAVPAVYPTELAKQNMGSEIDLNTIDYFRELGKLDTGPETIGFTPLLQSLIIQTTRGFEYMSYDDKYIQHIPVNNVVVSGKSKTMPTALFGPALGVFRVTADSLLLCYQSCCGLCTSGGRLLLPLTKFLCKPDHVAFHSPYLVVVSPELVEIRRIDTGRNTATRAKLCQVITGTDIRLLSSTEGQVRLAMAHPNYKSRQLVVELVINEFVAIDETSSLVTL